MKSPSYGCLTACTIYGIALTLSASPTHANQFSQKASLSSNPISLEHGPSKVVGNRWREARDLARLEQSVEDFNAQWVAGASSYAEATSRRRLICLPLDERFNPSMGSFSHEHVQTGDKMSVPRVLYETVRANDVQVPWLFLVSRVEGVTKTRVENVPETLANKPLQEVLGGILDCRAPDNYVFLPWWMMRSLGLQPRDVVDLKLITDVAPGSEVKLRPHLSKLTKDIANTQSVLEVELRHYSCLTQGTTIAFDYNGERYWFDVEELRAAPKGEKRSMVKTQDCDLATVFLKAKDVPKKQNNQAGGDTDTKE